MIDYCKKFREIEIQVHDVNFYNRFEEFIAKPLREWQLKSIQFEGEMPVFALIYEGVSTYLYDNHPLPRHTNIPSKDKP